MKRITIIILMAMIASLIGIRAQNRIDECIERYSTRGSAKFTSAVERDPATRKVVKVVKTLEIAGPYVEQIVVAFEHERNAGTYSRTVEGSSINLLLTEKGSDANRIYMLKYKGIGVAREGKAMIIIKFNN